MAKRTGAQDDGHVFAGQRVRDFLRRQIPEPGKHFFKKFKRFKIEICPDFICFLPIVLCWRMSEYIFTARLGMCVAL
jgi:hypothetical protein